MLRRFADLLPVERAKVIARDKLELYTLTDDPLTNEGLDYLVPGNLTLVHLIRYLFAVHKTSSVRTISAEYRFRASLSVNVNGY